MIAPDALRERAARLWEREGRKWAAGDAASAVLTFPLHPPTQREAIGDLEAARAWVDSWRGVAGVVWQERNWFSVGTQQIPVRVALVGADAIARAAGVSRQWQRWRKRTRSLLEALGEDAREGLITHGRRIGEMPSPDFARLRDVVLWLRENPTSNRFVRELPIRGIDSKWLGKHLRVVSDLVGSKDLGFRKPPTLARVRFLDGLPTDVTAPVEELNLLDVRARVLILENLQTFLAMPQLPSLVVVAGQGDAIDVLARIGWAQEALYWGDLDSHGFRILSKGRRAGLNLTSVLMGTDTLLEFRDLWVPEPKPHRGLVPHLNESERRTLDVLRAEGDVRLEQERVSWDWALDRLTNVVGETG